MLSQVMNPFSAYHRYINVNIEPTPLLYNVYEGAIWFFLFITICYGVFLTAKGLANKENAKTQYIYIITVTTLLFFLIIKTRESWSSHHIIIIRPFLFLALTLVAIEATARAPVFRKLAVALLSLITVAFVAIGIKGYVDMLHAKPIGGFYDVSWNSIDAVNIASNSDNRLILALDWGAFYPGAAISPPDQRWEMKTADDLVQLQKINASYGSQEFGVLFKINGPHRWLYFYQSPEKLHLTDITIFDRHKGEAWVFANVKQQVADVSEKSIDQNKHEHANTLIIDGEFVKGTKYWTYTKYELKPGSAHFSIDDNSDFPGNNSALLTHTNFADSRIYQEIILNKNRPYLVSAYVKTENVSIENKGAYLCIMDINSVVESLEVKGKSAWQKLEFIVTDKSEERKPLKVAARLGGYGSMNTGKMWIALFTVTETDKLDKHVPIYTIK